MLVAIGEAEIHIGVGVSLPTRPRTTQGDRLDAFDLTESFGRRSR